MISLPTKEALTAIGLQLVEADKPSLEKRSRIDVYCCVTTGTWESSAIPPEINGGYVIYRSKELCYTLGLMLFLLIWIDYSVMAMELPEIPVRSYENVDISKFQQLLSKSAEENEIWTNDPLQIILRFLPSFEGKIQYITRKHDSAESARRAEVIVIEEGYLDDSVRGGRYEFILEKDVNDRWKLLSAKKASRCWPNRGHEDFSKQPCL